MPNDRATLISLLSSLPRDEDPDFPEYEIRVNNLLSRKWSESDLKRVVADETLDLSVRWNALYLWLDILASNLDLMRFNMVFRKHQTVFRDEVLFPHLTAWSRYNDARYGEYMALRDALLLASKNLDDERLEVHPGVRNLFVEIVLRIAEEHPDFSEADHVQRAISLVNVNIDSYPGRARYYHMRARLYSIQNEFTLAYHDIAKAIDAEDSSNESQYTVRIFEYASTRQRIQAEERLDKQMVHFGENIVKLATDKTEEIQNKAFALLGILTAAIAIIMSTVSLASAVKDVASAAILITLMAGSILVAFTVFHIVLNFRASGKQRLWTPLSMSIATAVILLVVGALVGYVAGYTGTAPFNINNP